MEGGMVTGGTHGGKARSGCPSGPWDERETTTVRQREGIRVKIP